ncbi:MAG TPA: DUF3696 domain-containing protein [Acidobacteria bacterium]|nr:DUF3696 domain-containing protein [Acidobacteriota bacterium]
MKVAQLRRIEVAGYKSIRDPIDVEIAPLTIVAGANSSGKSSLIQPLLLLKQTLEAQFDPGPLRIDGDNVRFSHAREMTWDDGEEFTIGFSLAHRGVSLKYRVRNGFSKNDEVDRHGATALVDMTLHWYERNRPGGVTFMEGPLDAKERESFAQAILGKRGSLGQFKPENLVRDRCYLVPSVRPKDLDSAMPFPFLLQYAYRLDLPLDVLHVPGIRGNPERDYRLTQVGTRFPGTFETYTASVIQSWKDNSDQKPLLQRLGSWLRTLGLTWKVDVKPVDDTKVRLRVGRLPRARRGGARDLVNIADVGFGVSQVLPVLVALLAAQPGQIVYVEQPEIHLHPRAQVALAEILLERASEGVTVIAETHSGLLLRGVQRAIAQRKAPPDTVRLHWCTRNEDGATVVSTATLDEAGRFGDWPEDFADVELEVEAGYLDAAASALQETTR